MNLASIDKLLTTTRSVRKRLDLGREVPPEILEECLEIAIQAPTGSNLQGWRFLVVTDPDKKKKLADIYRKAFKIYAAERQKDEPLPADDVRAERQTKVVNSAVHLAGVMDRVPVLLVACIEGRVEKQPPVAQASLYGSIIPAAWSLMLALRARGLGAAWTTLHAMFEQEAAELLGIPADFTQAVLLPIAYYTGDDFRPGKRIPARELTYWNRWGETR